MPFNIGPGEVILVLIILLVVVGPGKLPEIGSAFGRTLKEFRKATTEIQDTANVASGTATPNRLAGAATAPNVLASEADAEVAGAARDVTPRGTPTDPVDEA
jgi:sec-independent protein translocase protein TatA